MKLYNSIAKMKILVTGGAGYIGCILVPMLLKEGYSVTVLDNLMYNQSVLLEHFRLPEFEFIRGDVRKQSDVRNAMKDIDMVVHLAALVGYPICDRHPETAKQVNYEGTINVNDARECLPLIYPSTGSVYGDLPDLCTEGSKMNPISLYSKTKLWAEKEIANTNTKGDYIIFRPATAFGISPRMRLDILINDFTYTAYTKKNLTVYQPEARRTFIHIHDFARALLHGMKSFSKMKNEVYNLGVDDLNVSKRDIVDAIHRHCDFYSHYANIGEDPDKRDYTVSYDKLEKTGFKGTMSLDDGIEELLKGFNMISIRNPYSNQIFSI